MANIITCFRILFSIMLLIGGMNKIHPTENEIQECVNFYEELLNRSFDIR